MQKNNRCRSTVRKPLAEVSNGRKPSKTSKKKAPEDKDDGTIDRLLLAHTNLSKLIHQIDELVVRAYKNKMTKDIGDHEIESFIHVISEMHSSLKAWVPRFQQAVGLLSTDAQLGQDLANKTVSAANGVRTPVSCGPIEPEQDLILSPSPLVSWCGGACTVESGKQLFLLTPLPKPKLGSSKFPGSSKPIAAKFAKYNPSCSKPLPSQNAPRASLVDPLEKAEVKPTPNKVGKSKLSGTNRPSGSGVLSPPKGSNIDRKGCSIYLLTPSLTTSSSKMHPCLGPSSESFQQADGRIQVSSPGVVITQNNDGSEGFIYSSSDEVSKSLAAKYQFSGHNISTVQKEVKNHKSTPWVARTQNNDGLQVSDNSSSDELSKSLVLRFPELYVQQPGHKTATRRKEVDDTLDWFLSPPKTCVLLEPPIEKMLQASARVKGFCNDDVPRLALIVPDSTPMWRDLGSTVQKGKKPGETTLKRELWTKFEAASANGLLFNATAFKPTERKGFLDMLEEASCETTDFIVT